MKKKIIQLLMWKLKHLIIRWINKCRNKKLIYKTLKKIMFSVKIFHLNKLFNLLIIDHLNNKKIIQKYIKIILNNIWTNN